jgi:hypothetical protein
MSKKISWFFAPTGGGGEEGFNHAGMSHFQADPHYYVARETIQNSLDATDSSKSGEPVFVEFKLLKVPIEEAIPELKQYKDVLTQCIESSTNDVAKRFFKNALKKLTKKTIPVLQISDFSTVGIEGINQEGGRWHKLIKLKGESTPEGNIGGTFGIGKSAPFTISGLRTLCYNTKNKDGESGFIWKSIFTKHGRPKKQNEGWYCEHFEDDYGDILTHGFTDDSNHKRPSFIERDVTGTDLFILDFLAPTDTNQPWNVVFEKAIMNNYFIAIYENELKVRFVDESKKIDYELSSTNIVDEMYKDYSINGSSSYQFLDSYIDYKNSGKMFTEKIKGLGECKLYVKLDENYERRVAYMRKLKMLVYDDINRNLNVGYSALFLCETKTGNNILSKCEGPTHDEWLAKWNEKPDIVAPVLKRLRSWVNKQLRTLVVERYTSETILGDLDHLSYHDDDEEIEKQSDGSDDKPENDEGFQLEGVEIPSWRDIHFIPPNPKKKRKQKKIVKSEDGFGPGDDDDQFGSGGQIEEKIIAPNPEPSPHPGPDLQPGGGDGENKLRKVPKSQYKYKCFLDAESQSYKLVISTKRETTCNALFFARGLEIDKNESIIIDSAINSETGEEYNILNNSVNNIKTSSDPIVIQVDFKDSRRFAVELELLA